MNAVGPPLQKVIAERLSSKIIGRPVHEVLAKAFSKREKNNAEHTLRGLTMEQPLR